MSSNQGNREKINIRPVTNPPRVKDGQGAKSSGSGDSRQDRSKMINDLLMQLQPEAPDETQARSKQQPDQQLVRQAAAKLSSAMNAAPSPTEQPTPHRQQQATPPTRPPQPAAPKPARPPQQKAPQPARPPQQTAPPPVRKQKPPVQQQPVQPEMMPVEDEIALKKWLGIVILAFIPLVNIVACIVWIKSKRTPPTQKAFAKAALIWIVIAWIAILVVSALLLTNIAAML